MGQQVEDAVAGRLQAGFSRVDVRRRLALRQCPKQLRAPTPAGGLIAQA